MCRLFGILSAVPVSASDPLINAPYSLLKQSHCNKKRLQGDGWGLGWISANGSRVFKRSQPIYRDSPNKRLKQVIGDSPHRRILMRCWVGHIRWASNPLKLPRRELIGLPHTQPFQHEQWLFAHNGTLYIPREVKAELGSWARYIQGKNDSEVLFYWLLKHLRGTQSVPQAVRQSVKGLHRIWASCRKKYPIYPQPYHGLNWVLTNGKTLLAFCYVDPKGFSRAKALVHRRQPYFELQMKQDAQTLTIASEPLDNHPGWQALGHGKLLIAALKRDRLVTKTYRIL